MYRRISRKIAYFKSDGISNDSTHIQKKSIESRKAWELNVSNRTLEIFNDYDKITRSNTFWLYQKTLKSKIYNAFFQILLVSRSRTAKFVKSIFKS